MHKKQEQTSLMMGAFACLNLTVWIHSVTSKLLINVDLMHLYKFRQHVSLRGSSFI